MLIIKPYGRSEADFDSKKKNLRRKIRRNPSADDESPDTDEITEFAKDQPKLVIDQWISMIDKIATKPRGNRKPKPTCGQWELREKLGRAAFKILDNEGLFSTDDNKKKKLKRLWWSKIHPYFSTKVLDISASVNIWRSETHPCRSKIQRYLEEPSKNKKGELDPKEIPKNHWYGRFVGDKEPADISEKDADVIAKKIHEHLYEKEYRKGPNRPNKNKGLIAARAESIDNNVTTLLDRLPDREHPYPWSKQDEDNYKQAGDIAKQILEKAEEKKHGKFFLRDAAPILHEQYGRLFNNDGKPLCITEARDRSPGLFALHSAIKDTYTRILKHNKKGGYNKKGVARVLPKDMNVLLRLVESKWDNRNLNALIRLGKVICYEADSVANIDANWPEDKDLQESRYRTSVGQAEIKRNEAFVRVWRYTIALGARTLKDWADPDNSTNRDILTKIKKVIKKFCESDYQKKLPLLFGNQGDRFFKGNEEFEKSVLKLALEKWYELRNATFHFKGHDRFNQALTNNLSDFPAAINATRELLKNDLDNHHKQLIEDLRAAHVEEYYNQKQLDALFKVIVNAETSLSPLPRFNRVLARAENAWQSLHLPPPGKRDKLEKQPGQLCRYITAKALYERAFPAWLEKQPAQELNKWIKCAVKRATKAAQEINKDELAVARAAGLIHLKKDQGISDFIDQLAARTATELRVQRGYNSDPDKARKQAKYLMTCGVMWWHKLLRPT